MGRLKPPAAPTPRLMCQDRQICLPCTALYETHPHAVILTCFCESIRQSFCGPDRKGLIIAEDFIRIYRDRIRNVERIFKSNKYKTLLVVLCSLGWSLAYPLIKKGYQEFHIGADDLGGKILFGGVRFFLAGVFVTLFCVFRKIRLDLKDKKDLWWLLLLALVNTTFHYMFAYIGLGYNASARSTILDSLSTFILIFISWKIFEDDKMNSNKIIGCLLGLLGILMINVQPGKNFFEDITFRGDGMILLNVLFSAWGGLLTRIVSKKMNIMMATGLSMTIGGALMLLAGLVIGPDQPWTVTGKGLLILLALIMISAVCFAVYNELIAWHPISEIAIYNALIPVLGVIFSALILKEELKWQYLLSVLLVAAGIYLVNAEKKDAKKA